MYFWKASGTTPISIETLGAMAAITMIILTSDVTSAGIFFFFLHLRDVRDYAVFQLKKIQNKK